MKMRFNEWLINIGVLASLAAILFACPPAHADDSTVSSATITYYGSEYVDPALKSNIEKKFQSYDGINTFLLKPISTGSTMSTLDSAQSFTAQMFCPASTKFMEVDVLPSSTGDINSITMQMDTNMDGFYDYTFTTGAAVISGVCINGFIHCDAGTWNNCGYYKWTSSNDKPAIATSSQEELSGCFCINNSCGSNILYNQNSLLMQVIGGGILAAMQAVNPKYAATVGELNPYQIIYYAQNSSDCTIGNVTGSASDPTSYYGSPTTIDSAASTQASADAANSTSLYAQLLTSKAMASSAADYKTCKVTRTFAVNTTGVLPTYTWEPWLDLTVHVYMGRDSDNYINYTNLIDTNHNGYYDLTDTPSEASGIISCDDMGYGNDISIMETRLLNYVAYYQSLYGVSVTDVQVNPVSYVTGLSDGGGKKCTANESWMNNYKWDRKSLPKCDPGYTYVAADGKCYIESTSTTISDQCSIYQGDGTCTKRDEIVDGVYVFQNYQTTGLEPLDSCKSQTGSLGIYQDCEPWWEKNITYRCAPSSFDFSAISARSNSIADTTYQDSAGLHYIDAITDSSGVVTYSTGTMNYNVMQDGSISACEFACKTEMPWDNTAASGSSTKANTATSTSTYMIFVKTCTSDGSCPVDSSKGEVEVMGCQCMSSFTEGAAALDIISAAADDMICSLGTIE